MTEGRPPGGPRALPPEPSEGPPLELGDEVLWRGRRYLLDDEALVGLEGQPDVPWDDFDPAELVPWPTCSTSP